MKYIIDPCCRSGNLLKPSAEKGDFVFGICTNEYHLAYSVYNLTNQRLSESVHHPEEIGTEDIPIRLYHSNNCHFALIRESEYFLVINLLISYMEGKYKMKFGYCIMNPPYGNLHLPILKTMVEKIVDKNDGEIVSIQPVRWLQEDYDKTKSAFLRNKCIITEHGIHLWEGFDAGAPIDLGIYKIKKGKDNLDKIILKTWCYFGSNKNLTIKKYSPELKNFVPIKGIFSGRGEFNKIGKPLLNKSILYKTHYGYFITGKSKEGLCQEGLTLAEAFAKNKKATQGKIENWDCVIFKTPEETKNFWDYIHLSYFCACMLAVHVDVHIHMDRLPFPKDFSKNYSNSDFLKLFPFSKEEKEIIKKAALNWEDETK
jgi:hypothetical protein